MIKPITVRTGTGIVRTHCQHCLHTGVVAYEVQSSSTLVMHCQECLIGLAIEIMRVFPERHEEVITGFVASRLTSV